MTVLMGETAAKMRRSAEKAGRRYATAANMRIAVETAYRSGCPGSCCSALPAASFDAYRNYAERGEDFVRAVKSLL